MTRRRLIAAGALLLASGPAARAMASTGSVWVAYAQRLSARLRDAGGGAFDRDIAQDLLTATNRFRTGQGLARLEWDDGLADCARAHAADMAARSYFAHASPEGFTHIDRVSLLQRDLCASTAENLAWRAGPAESDLPSRFESMWEASPGHRRNLQDPSFREVGYGAVRLGDRVYVAGVYGDVAVRLGQALPLSVSGQTELADAVAGASPHIDRLSLTAPFQRPTWMRASNEALPALEPGIWQLRPLRASGPSRYDVLPGPLFQVG